MKRMLFAFILISSAPLYAAAHTVMDGYRVAAKQDSPACDPTRGAATPAAAGPTFTKISRNSRRRTPTDNELNLVRVLG
jgi:hypothetical protein